MKFQCGMKNESKFIFSEVEFFRLRSLLEIFNIKTLSFFACGNVCCHVHIDRLALA